MLKHLELTPALLAAIDSVERAERSYIRGGESSGAIEIPKLGLADAVMAAVAAQRIERLEGLPRATPAPASLADLERVRKPRRRRA